VIEVAYPGLVLTALGGSQPVQGTGTIRGLPLYLRLRSSSRLYIAGVPGGDPVDVGRRDPATGCFTAGWALNLNDLVPQVMEAQVFPYQGAGTDYYTGWATRDESYALLVLGLRRWEEERVLYAVPRESPVEILASVGAEGWGSS
jgi:hypothetical protein